MARTGATTSVPTVSQDSVHPAKIVSQMQTQQSKDSIVSLVQFAAKIVLKVARPVKTASYDPCQTLARAVITDLVHVVVPEVRTRFHQLRVLE